MSFNHTPGAERVHIGFFGRRNAGKSSVVNAVTGQELSVVSEVKGTTTDPVQKAMELLPLGPVVVIDTPGIDDEGALGELRVRKTRQILNKIDAAVLVVDGTGEPAEADRELIRLFQEKQIPFLVAVNKADAAKEEILEEKFGEYENRLIVSGKTGFQIQELKEKIANLAAVQPSQRRIVGDLLKPGDTAVLVVPIDQAAPKGRLILPQQQTIRDILEADAAALVVKENGLKEALKSLGKKPALVITDSQVFGTVSADTPKDIPLTSFSILFARYKGNLQTVVRGAAAIKSLQQGDRVLISEGCTHHRQCEDIGSVKLPRWLKEYTKKELSIELTSGTEFPEDLSPYRLIIHCGGCMLNEREMKYRLKCAEDQGIPMTNYGIAIACMQGILRRSVELFPQVLAELQQEEV
ncbi:MAG: [FeFe] hydrogenase H-cluster maturation GTPase HydF [Lachnospiraceae bacterium]|jgi:[FeFe] hydrogenase H-cluster maturation GTPase HydF|nr:[FeFe] hydrogenase H-cluster maturation GTPase HydF [Lachnospiraceae bacterium]